MINKFNTSFSKLFKKNPKAKGKFTALKEVISASRAQIWSGRDYSTFADKAYTRNIIAFRAINLVAIAAASIPIKLFRITKNEEKICVKAHPLLNILQHPNPLTSRAAFIESLVKYKLISGNCYILKVAPTGKNQPEELYLLRPDRIEVLAGQTYLPIGYRYKVEGSVLATDLLVDPLTGDSPVLHIKNFHPFDDWYGLSPIEAASYSIDQHNQASAWNQAMLKNSARPSGALIVKNDKDGNGNLSPEQYQNLREQINEYYTGAEQTGRPILLEGGLDWKEMSLSPKDMDFIQSKNNSAREITLAFGVPPQLLGIPGDNTYANLVEARVALWEETVIPLLSEIIENLNRWLVPHFGADLEFKYDREAIEALLQKREKLWQYIENSSFMSVNEKRQLFGLSPVKGGDEIKI